MPKQKLKRAVVRILTHAAQIKSFADMSVELNRICQSRSVTDAIMDIETQFDCILDHNDITDAASLYNEAMIVCQPNRPESGTIMFQNTKVHYHVTDDGYEFTMPDHAPFPRFWCK